MDGLWKNRSLNKLKNKYYLLERKSKIILKYHFQLLYDTLILFLNYDHIDRYTHTYHCIHEYVIMHFYTYMNKCLTRERERNVLFNDALNTFYLRLYGVRHMVKDHSDSEKGNLLPPHRLLLSINSKGSFICTIPQTG